MKSTKQKEAILAAVCIIRTHPTADEIYEKLRKDFPKISLGTVYRNLNRFVEKGEITKISIPNAGDRFDFRIDKHQHLLCDNCKKLFDININIDINILDENISISGYSLIINGLCTNCNN